MTYHLVIDIETLGTSSDAMILEVACVLLPPDEDKVPACYHAFVKYPTGNATVDTVQFHNKQTNLFERYFTNQDQHKQMQQIVSEINLLTEPFKDDIIVWSWGLDFDLPILRTSAEYHSCKFLPNIHYRNFRCLRTLVSTLSLPQPSRKQEGRHEALSDAVYESEVLQEALSFLESLQTKWQQNNDLTGISLESKLQQELFTTKSP